jgi:uncharacterized protein YraI
MSDEERQAQKLGDHLDNLFDSGQPLPTSDPDPLVNAALRLANAPRPELSAQQLARIQARVLQANRRAVHRLSSPRIIPIFRWAMVASLVLVVFTIALTPALANSLPGDALYPVKRTLEGVELALAGSGEARANIYLTQAARRADEALALLQRGTFDSTLVTDAVATTLQASELAAQQPNSTVLVTLQSRVVQVDTALGNVLDEASRKQLVSGDALATLERSRETLILGGNLPVPTPTPPTIAVQASPSEAPTATLTQPATATATPLPTSTPAAAEAAVLIETLTPDASATFTLTPTTTPFMMAIIRSKQPVNVREGPGLGFKVIAALQPGTRLPVLGWNPDGTWLNVVLSDGRSAWIASSLMQTGDFSDASSSSQDNLPPSTDTPAPGTNSGGSSASNSSSSDFGCDHPGNYCNAPGQQSGGTKGDSEGGKKP